MKIANLACAVLLCSSASVNAEETMQYRNEGGEVFELQQKPCHQGGQVGFQYAEWRNKTDTVKGCWSMWKGIVLIYFDDNDYARIPVQHFKKADVI